MTIRPGRPKTQDPPFLSFPVIAAFRPDSLRVFLVDAAFLQGNPQARGCKPL